MKDEFNYNNKREVEKICERCHAVAEKFHDRFLSVERGSEKNNR